MNDALEDTHWQPMNPALAQHLSETAYSWLTDSSSLTKRLRTFTHNEIEHHLFYDDWGIVDKTAYGTLRIDTNQKTWIRRMEWRHKNNIWVACTVIIPESSITDETSELSHIGRRSIGDILFQDPTLKRSEFFYQQSGKTVSRFSTFYFKQQPIGLIETFLPAFFQAIA